VSALLPDRPGTSPLLTTLPSSTAGREHEAHADGRYAGFGYTGTTTVACEDDNLIGSWSSGVVCSAARAWTTINQAIVAAAPGALVAVAAGTYVENVLLEGKPVRLWGVCPERVSIETTGVQDNTCPPKSVCILDGASQTEVGGVALTGPGGGAVVSGSEAVLIDRVWAHDLEERGLGVQDTLGPTAVDVRGSLFETSHEYGVYVSASELTMEASVVRGTLPRVTDQLAGRGLEVLPECVYTSSGLTCDATKRSTVTVIGSLIERNHDVGVGVAASDLRMDASVVRGTLPQLTDQTGGRGLNLQLSCNDGDCDTTSRASVEVFGSLVEGNQDLGIFVGAADLRMEASVVRGTLPRASDQKGGRGLSIHEACVVSASGLVCDPTARSTVAVVGSLFEDNFDMGVFVGASDLTMDGSVVRGTLPRVADQRFGRGLDIQASCSAKPIGPPCDPASRSQAAVVGSLFEDNYDTGVFVYVSDLTVDASVIRRTQARSDGLFGDGLNSFDGASVTANNSAIWDSARAGIGIFGASVEMSSLHIGCAAFPLTGAPFEDSLFDVVDAGGNLCGCPTPDQPCKLVSANLEPPDPLAGE
jgi:hypothetical protein